jgi:predicted phage terminase large subunit-like protein
VGRRRIRHDHDLYPNHGSVTLLSVDPDLLQYATEDERKAYQEALAVEQALMSPLDFAERAEPGVYKRYPHTELLNRLVVAHTEHAVYEDGIGPPAVWTPDPDDPEDGRWLHPETGAEAVEIVVVSAPPQHGKSFAVTENAPGWYVAKYPDRRVILSGYEADFAKTFSRKNREKVESAKIPGIRVSDETSAADNWTIAGHPGGVVSAGAGGPITGKGAHLFIIDDPVKNSEDAMSEAKRRKNWDWWLSTVKTRMRKGGVIFIIQTRWHEDDLAGRVIRNERCFVLNIPALAFEGDPDPEDGTARDPDTGQRDPLGRRPGQALCPDLHTRATLEDRRDRADSTDAENPGGALWFSCLYQGKPIILGGGILPGPYLNYVREGDIYTLTTAQGGIKRYSVDDLDRFITADLAASVKTRADWTVFSLWGWTPGRELLLLDMDRMRSESPDHEDKAEAFWNRCKADHGPIRYFAVENVTFGMALVQAMLRSGRVPVRPLAADKDKRTRAFTHAGPLLVAGRVYFPPTTWAKEFIKECQAFDNGTHDDMVDTFSYAAQVATTMLPRPKVEIKAPENRIDRHRATRLRKKRRGTHPTLGRW